MKKIVCGVLIIFVGIVGCLFGYKAWSFKIEEISYNVVEEKIYAYLKFKNGSIYSCYNDQKEGKITDNTCEIEVANEKGTVTVKKDFLIKKININPDIRKVLSFKVEPSTVYLLVDEKEKITYSLDTIGEVNDEVIWSIKDPSIAKIEKGEIIGLKVGTTTLQGTIQDQKQEIKIIVSDLLTKPTLNEKKPIIPCHRYSKEETTMLDYFLKKKITDAGYQTRAGVVAALRFLTLEFPYRIPYFFENGRLNNNTGGAYVDGEGRFYHEGLYLDNSKQSLLKKIAFGPASWGCPLTNWQEEAGFVRGVRYPNGLDCSGFITWAMLNGGFDVSDTGAGDNDWRDDDLSDLGSHQPITKELLNSNKLKAGDIIASDGHIAMIGGIDDKNVYVAESTTYYHGVVMHTYSKEELTNYEMLNYVIFMDDYYKKDGNYTQMW